MARNKQQSNVIDWERANRALKVLDQLARDNPQYCFQSNTVPWSENLTELESALDEEYYDPKTTKVPF